MRKLIWAGMSAVIIACACQPRSDHEERIQELTGSLLPPTRVAGEALMRLEDRMAFHHVPGVSIAVIDDFELQWVRHFGVVSAQDPMSVSDATLFSVGSLSKAVTAAAVLSLVNDGLIDLDCDVNQQLRSWQVPFSELTASETVTPRRLLNHTGGIVLVRPPSYAADRIPTTLQLLNGELPAQSGPVAVDKVPGSVFQYSNAGYAILRLLVEDVCGKPFAEVARERVLEPAGMLDSSFAAPLPESLFGRMARGHDGEGNLSFAGHRWHGYVAAGGLWTTAADYARFVLELQRTLAGRSHILFSQELATEMVSPHDSDRYGLGVFLHRRDGTKEYFSHIGDGLGFVAGFAAHRSSGQAAVVMSNGVGGIHLVREIMAAVAAVYGWADYLPPEQQPLVVSPEDLDRMTGRYLHDFDTLVELHRQDDELWLKAGTGFDVHLFAVAEDRLVCAERAGQIGLVRAASGEVDAVRVGLANEIGLVPETPAEARRMAPGEMTPREMLTNGRVAEAISRYRRLSQEQPEHPAISEDALNRLGYSLLGRDPAVAVAVFELNAELYPLSANCHDSLGEGLFKDGRSNAARTSYLRSLELDPGNDNARKMLALIEAEG